MNDSYSEVREYLRQEHAKNTNEIYGRNIHTLSKSGYYGSVQENNEEAIFWTFSIRGKFLLFFACVMLFSCYLYGGQDVKKGAVMAWSDMQRQITVLEEENSAVKEVVEQVKTIYHTVRDYVEEFTGDMRQDSERQKN